MAPIVAPVDRAGTGALTVEILDSVSSSECSFPYAGSRQTALPSEGTAARGASILFAIHRSRPAGHCCMGFGQKNYLDNLAMATRVDPSVLA